MTYEEMCAKLEENRAKSFTIKLIIFIVIVLLIAGGYWLWKEYHRARQPMEVNLESVIPKQAVYSFPDPIGKELVAEIKRVEPLPNKVAPPQGEGAKTEFLFWQKVAAEESRKRLLSRGFPLPKTQGESHPPAEKVSSALPSIMKVYEEKGPPKPVPTRVAKVEKSVAVPPISAKVADVPPRELSVGAFLSAYCQTNAAADMPDCASVRQITVLLGDTRRDMTPARFFKEFCYSDKGELHCHPRVKGLIVK
jgi:hypothetical protein